MVGKRFPASNLLAYVIAQLAGGIAGAAVLYVIASGTAGFDLAAGSASNGYAAHSPGGIFDDGVPDRRSSTDIHVSDDYSGRHGPAFPPKASRPSRSDWG